MLQKNSNKKVKKNRLNIKTRIKKSDYVYLDYGLNIPSPINRKNSVETMKKIKKNLKNTKVQQLTGLTSETIPI